jgi:hypothetical protein
VKGLAHGGRNSGVSDDQGSDILAPQVHKGLRRRWNDRGCSWHPGRHATVEAATVLCALGFCSDLAPPAAPPMEAPESADLPPRQPAFHSLDLHDADLHDADC